MSEIKEAAIKEVSDNPSTLLFTTMDTVPLEDLEKLSELKPLSLTLKHLF